MRVTPSSTVTDAELQESEREREELKYKFDQQEAQIQALKNQLHIKNAVEVAPPPPILIIVLVNGTILRPANSQEGQNRVDESGRCVSNPENQL
jgi:hypothetical protein